jgi:hypothetical protein
MLLEKVDCAADEIIDKNLTMDMTEQQIINLLYEEDPFIRSISSGCPTSFLACC